MSSLKYMLGAMWVMIMSVPPSSWRSPSWTTPSSDISVIFDNWNMTNLAWNVGASVVSFQGEYVLEAVFPKGSRNPEHSPQGGLGFYSSPIDMTNKTTLTFSYDVWFGSGTGGVNKFKWVKGGKLPGLYGGHTRCSGGYSAKDCFSTRYMWRKNGLGEIYLYLPLALQTPGFCHVRPQTVCDPDWGTSLGRGSFSFTDNKWNSLQQIIVMNSFASNGTPNHDGSVTVSFGYNGVVNAKIHFNQVVWRSSPTVQPLGIMFDTFFGGSTNDYATPIQQNIYFRNFSLSVA